MGVSGDFSRILSPPCFCAAASAWSESIFKNAASKTCVLALLGLYPSSVLGLMPREGASGAALPDHTNDLTARCVGEANAARHTAHLPSCPLVSVVATDSMRKACASRCQPRAAIKDF